MSATALQAPAPAQTASPNLLEVTQGLATWLESFGEVSYDHQTFFAGPVGRRAKRLYYDMKWLGVAAVAPIIFFEAFVPSARQLFWKKQRLPIADAHWAMGHAFLYQVTGKEHYYRRAVHFLDVLEASAVTGFSGAGWGYPFHWETRGGTFPADVPLITTVPYVYEAFRQVHSLDADPRWMAMMQSIATHASADYEDFEHSDTTSSCAYFPGDAGGRVINASAYRAFLLLQAAADLGNTEYEEIGLRNLRFVLESQRANGSWPYATDSVRDFIDHFHTCFVLKALAKIEAINPGPDTTEAIERGVGYYVEHLFDEEGLPKPFSKAPRLTVYRRELYDCAECINLGVLLRGRFPELDSRVDRTIADLLQTWLKPDGSFRSRRLHAGWDNVPMHRWGQSQLFRSLAFKLAEDQ